MGWSEEDEYQEQQICKRIAKEVAEEREACAKIADELRGRGPRLIAEAIRTQRRSQRRSAS